MSPTNAKLRMLACARALSGLRITPAVSKKLVTQQILRVSIQPFNIILASDLTITQASIQNWENICLLEVVPPVTVSITSCLPTATPTSNAISNVPQPANAQTTQATGADHSLSTTEKFEIGIGIGVGVPVLVALIMTFVIMVKICKRRRRHPRLTQYNLDRVYGTSAENLHDHEYLNEARAVPTTMYANPVSPLESFSRSNRPFPLSTPVSDIPVAFSRDPKKMLEQTPSPLKTPPAFEAFHPSKRIVPITQSLRSDVRHSSHAYPESSQRPESIGSSRYSEEVEKGPYEMGL